MQLWVCRLDILKLNEKKWMQTKSQFICHLRIRIIKYFHIFFIFYYSFYSYDLNFDSYKKSHEKLYNKLEIEIS